MSASRCAPACAPMPWPVRTVPTAGRTADPAVDGLLQAYAELLPAVNTLVGHHFTRTLVRVALDHVEREGSDEEREAVWDRIRAEGGPGPTGRRHREQPVTADPVPGGDRASTGISLEAAARARQADLPTGAEKTVLVQSMFDAIAPRYDLVNRTMTFGLDVRWRKQSLRALGPAPGFDRPRSRLRHG